MTNSALPPAGAGFVRPSPKQTGRASPSACALRSGSSAHGRNARQRDTLSVGGQMRRPQNLFRSATSPTLLLPGG